MKETFWSNDILRSVCFLVDHMAGNMQFFKIGTWHMIIGGKSSTRTEPTVELYNYESGEQCFLPDMPKGNFLGNAAWLNSTAVVCDGGWSTTNCTMFNQTSNAWNAVRSLKKHNNYWHFLM